MLAEEGVYMLKKLPLMDLKRQYDSMSNQLDNAVLKVLSSGQYILGDEVLGFEKKFAAYIGTKYAIGVGNGTDALLIALRAIGIKPGDEVITCAMSFFATAEAIAAVGAIPVFVDCEKDSYTINTNDIEAKITERTKAIIPVHLYGQCADMESICKVAQKYGLAVIEDASQAAGSCYKDKKAGSWGDIGCFSLFPTKNLGCAGDGGIITTDREDIYKRCLSYRVHGSGNGGVLAYACESGQDANTGFLQFTDNPKYYNFVIGYNSRLDAIQAAILSCKLPYLDRWNERRREIAQRYNSKINNKKVGLPYNPGDRNHIYYVYVITTENRDELRKYLGQNGITTGVYFPIPLHLQKAFDYLGYGKGDMPWAEYIAEYSLAIPLFPELTDSEIDYVIDKINEF